MPGAEVDRILLERIRAGDAQALGELYDRWVDSVHGVAANILGDLDEAEDVVDRTFMYVWAEARRYSAGRGSVGTWIILLARSRALDRRRAADTRRRLEGGSRASGERASAPSPLDDAVARSRSDAVHRGIRALPPRQQEVVRMTFFRGLSQQETAEHLSIPLGTVKTRVRLALAKLRKTLSSLQEGGT